MYTYKLYYTFLNKIGNTNLVHVASFITKINSNNIPILIIKMVHNLNIVHSVLHCPK